MRSTQNITVSSVLKTGEQIPLPKKPLSESYESMQHYIILQNDITLHWFSVIHIDSANHSHFGIDHINFLAESKQKTNSFFFKLIFKIFCWTKVHIVGPLITPVLDFMWPFPQVSKQGWFSHLHTYLLVCCESKGHIWCYTCFFHQ